MNDATEHPQRRELAIVLGTQSPRVTRGLRNFRERMHSGRQASGALSEGRTDALVQLCLVLGLQPRRRRELGDPGTGCDWIEVLLGADPDAGSGEVEWALVSALLFIPLTLAAFARCGWRRSAEAAASA